MNKTGRSQQQQQRGRTDLVSYSKRGWGPSNRSENQLVFRVGIYWLRLTAAIVIMFNSAMTIEINIVNNHHYLVVVAGANGGRYNTVRFGS